MGRLPIFLLSATFGLFFQNPCIIKADDPTFSNCYNSANYTSGSQFETNLDNVFSSLYANTAFTRFNTTVYGDDPDQVYGLFQCRGDSTLDECQSCVENATTEIVQVCPFRKEGVIRYWDCELHYADRDFFGQIDNQFPKVFAFPVDNVSDLGVALYDEKIGELMGNLSTAAASNASKFAIGRISYQDNLEFIYGMLQCTSDLSDSDCYMCLQNIIADIPGCCQWRSGGNVITVSCNLRYEKYAFFELLSPPPPSPTQVSPPPSANDAKGTTNTTQGNGDGTQVSPPPSANDGQGQKGQSSTKYIIITVVVLAMAAVILVSVLCIYFYRKKKPKSEIDGEPKSKIDGATEINMVQFSQFDFDTIQVATNDFSDSNKLGQGGFGAVYKGKLLNGQEIAVKRLSKDSLQGEVEFKNEVVIVAKLQHRNLVQLLGFSSLGQEKLLIYEFLPNASLDHFIFDPIKRTQLDWDKRHKIIRGIARGLLYLHEDSQHRIIHRDLKASNILLDEEMNPKISDFGMARLFVVDQTQNTYRIVGTYGYMAPEYALHGFFSVKSDVFSFGVLLLEIVSGRKSIRSSQSQDTEDLLTYAWRNWTEGTVSESIDATLRGNCAIREVMRCIHIGLLCVQENADDRPTMAQVDLMFNSSSITLPIPSSPAFVIYNKKGLDKSSSMNDLRETEPVSYTTESTSRSTLGTSIV